MPCVLHIKIGAALLHPSSFSLLCLNINYVDILILINILITIHSVNESPQIVNFHLYAWLSERVVVM